MSARVWMNNGKRATCIREDEIHILQSQGYILGRKKSETTSGQVPSLIKDLIWEINPGTELVNPMHFPYFNGKFVPRIYIEDRSTIDDGFCVIEQTVVDFKHVVTYSPSYKTLEQAKTYAEAVIRGNKGR